MTGTRVLGLGWRLARYEWRRFAAGTLLWVAYAAAPAAVGLGLRALFDAITGAGPSGPGVPALAGGLVGIEGLRLVAFFGAFVLITQWWVRCSALLRTNLLRAQLASGGPDAGPAVPRAGAAVPVFRDDTHDLIELVDCWIDLAGVLTFTVAAVVVMLRVDVLLTLVVVLPLVAVVAVNTALTERLRRVRLADREATARVTGLLGNLFSSVLAVKVAGAEEHAVRRLAGLNAERRRTALADKLLTQSLEAFNSSTVDVTIGLVLLLVAGAMRAGDFTVGDLALFASYIGTLSGLPRWTGILLARHRHAQVAARRLQALLPRGDAALAVVHRPLRLDRVAPPRQRPRAVPPQPAEVVLRGLGVRHRDGSGVTGVDLRLAPGWFTVVTGPIGSGKSTLLRGLLGLAGEVTGEVRYDGRAVEDLAAFMVPPRAACVPQVPHLYSATLRDNLTLGVETSAEQLAEAVHAAAFDADVAAMPDGLDTVVGPRGVRLSGGQLQRAATARALVAEPALLVLDDLSSALDAATERRLWARLLDRRRGRPPTVLVVSHRAAAFDHADQVVVLEGGRVASVAGRDALDGRPGALGRVS